MSPSINSIASPTHRKTVIARSIIFLISFCLCSCGVTSYRVDVANHYMPKDWMKYDKQEQQEYSGFQLIEQAKKIDSGLTDVLSIHGEPDYVRAASKTRLNLAYLQKGVVLSFNLKSGIAPIVTPYQNFNLLSQSLVMEFKSMSSVDVWPTNIY